MTVLGDVGLGLGRDDMTPDVVLVKTRVYRAGLVETTVPARY